MEPLIRYSSTYGRINKKNSTRENDFEALHNSSTLTHLHLLKNQCHKLKLSRKDFMSTGKHSIKLRTSMTPALRLARSPLNEYTQPIVPIKTRNNIVNSGLISLNNSRKYIGINNNNSFLGTQPYETKTPTAVLSIRSKEKCKRQTHIVQIRRNTNSTEKSFDMLNKGKDKLRLKEYNEAIMCFEKAYKLDIKNIEAMLYKGIALMDGNKVAKAIQVFQEVLSKNSVNKSAYYLLAVAYKKMKNVKRALEALESALNIDDNYLEALICRADVYMSIKEWTKAKEDLNIALRVKPKNQQVHLLIAECEEILGNTEQALAQYNKALLINPFISKESYMKKARLEMKMKDYTKALKTIDKLNNKNDLDICMLKAKILEKTGRTGDAAMQYELIAKQEHSKAIFKLAKMNLRHQDYYEAYFNIKRIKKGSDSKIELYRKLIEGMISLMKNKDGMNCLINIKDDVMGLKFDIKYMYYVFKAYGHMSLHEYSVFFSTEKLGSYRAV